MITSIMVIGLLAAASNASAWEVSNCITLTPPTADNQLPQDSTHKVVATVTTTYDPAGHPNITDPQDPDYWDRPNQSVYWFGHQFYPGLEELPYPDLCSGPGASSMVPAAGVTVKFDIISGPNAGQTGTAVTDANGQVYFQWTSSTAGTDIVQATDMTNTTPTMQLNAQHQSIPVNVATNTCAKYYGGGPNVCPTAIKNWLPPQVEPPVTPSGVPASTLTVSKRCQTRTFKISSNWSNGTPTKWVLQVDGKTIKTTKYNGSSKSGKKSFSINSGKYKAGTHSIKLTTYYSDGSRVVKTGKFKRCAVRTSQRRVSPNFTG